MRQTCTISETCLSTAMTYLKMMKDNVGNYLKQDTRMKRANSTVDNKSGKKGIFGPTLRRIVKAGGGNKSNLQCSGSSTSKGALQLKNLTDTLLKCEKTINASCDKESFPHPNMTAVKECKTAMTSFTTLVTSCQKKSGSEACTCWTDTAFTPLVATIKNCSISDDSKAIVKQMGLCKGNFSLCKKFEDEGLVAISACSESTADLLTKAKALTASKTGLTAAKTAASTLSTRLGQTGRAAATTCAEVVAKITALLKAVGENPASSTVATLAGEVTGVTVTCTNAEKTSLKGQVTSISTAITAVDEELATVQSDLLTATGTTASTSAISGASTATSSSSGRRNIVARHLMNHFNLN